MVVAVGHYVQGQKLAFPFGERLLAGPFETLGEAWAELERLRPLYPDANLRPHTLRKRKLPVVSPRQRHNAPADEPAGFDLSRVEQRRAAARHIAEHCRLHGFDAVIEDWDGEPDVDVTLPGARCNIWLGNTPAAPMPIISWVAGPGRAFRETHHRKRTDQPATWPALLDALLRGLLDALDGSAFVP